MVAPDAAVATDPARMHRRDERLRALVLDYVTRRLAMPEAPLDHPGSAAELDALLSGLVTAGGPTRPPS